jgi:hypothetical protein
LTSVSAAISTLGQSLSESIDEFRIYDADLTPAQIQADYAAGPDALAMPVDLTETVAAQKLVVTWPSDAAGFGLESSPTFGTGATWTATMADAIVTNDVNWLALPVSGAAGYFRLRRPSQ